MNFIKFETHRTDSGKMVYGTGRKIGCFYTTPEQPGQPFLKTANTTFYYNWEEMAEIALFLAHPERDSLPTPLRNLGLHFSHIGFEENVLPLLTASNSWEIPSEKVLGYPGNPDKFFFWSCDLGSSRQANEKEVAHMLHQLFKPQIHQVGRCTKVVMFEQPEYQSSAEGLKGVLLNEGADEQKWDAKYTVKNILGLPEEYLISQFSTGLSKRGVWVHTNGGGAHIFNGTRWEQGLPDDVWFSAKTKGAANKKLLCFLRSPEGVGFVPFWACQSPENWVSGAHRPQPIRE